MDVSFVRNGDTPDYVILKFDEEKLELSSVSTDERRAIYELDTLNGTYQFFEVFCSDLPLGKHFHLKKDEEFTILSGKGFVLLCTVNDDCSQKGEVQKIDLVPGSVVKVPSGTAHTFYLDSESSMACVSTMPFDASDMIPVGWLVQ